MERGSGRYNNYNHNRRSCGHQSSGQASSNSNNQHLENHHHHHHHNQSSAHHHRNASVAVSSIPSSTQLQMHTNNGFKPVSMPSAFPRETLTQHDELIRYINEAWTKVSEHGSSVVYRNDSDQLLKNFKPFNLEEYWGQRLVQNIHVSHNHQ